MRYLALGIMVIGFLALVPLWKRLRSRKNYMLAASAGLFVGIGYSILMVLNEEGLISVLSPLVTSPLFFMLIFAQIGTQSEEQKERDQRIGTIVNQRLGDRRVKLLLAATILGLVGFFVLGLWAQFAWGEAGDSTRLVLAAGIAISIVLVAGPLSYLWYQRRRVEHEEAHRASGRT